MGHLRLSSEYDGYLIEIDLKMIEIEIKLYVHEQSVN